MPDAPATPEKHDPSEAAFGKGPARAHDLSAEIVQAVDRRPGDVVRCTKVVGNMYRCNWWAPENTSGYDNPAMGGLLVTTHRVRQSHFLRATRAADGRLTLVVLSASAG